MQGLQPRVFLALMLAWAAVAAEAQPGQSFNDAPDAEDFASLEQAAPIELGTGDYQGQETARIQAPGARFVKVHFDRFDVPDGVVVEVSNEAGTELYRYGNDAFDAYTLDRGRGDDGTSRFYALSITGDTAVVSLTGALHRFDPRRHAVVVDSWLAGPDRSTTANREDKYAPDPISELESTCGGSQRYNARCYRDSHPAAYDRSIPVALLITSSGEECTAWRVSASNRMFTAGHCVSGQDDLDGAEIWFQYRTQSCTGSTTIEPVKVTGGKLLASDSTLDYALFTVDDFDRIAYLGYLGLDVREGARGEEIFIPQHGLGRPKQIAIESDMNTSGWCEIDEDDYDGYGNDTDIGYFCDTTTSSSGAPVVSGLTGRVIALHHLGGCFNAASKVALIWPQVKSHFGGAIPTDDGTAPWTYGPPAQNEPPDAQFSASCDNLECSFDGSGSDDTDGSIERYQWDFGDGSEAAGAQVGHGFAEAGSFVVKLTVVDDDGASDSYSKSVDVSRPNARPEARFSAQCQHNACQFDGSASSDDDGEIVSWAWQLGDGAKASGTQVSHSYREAGSYTITLTVKDNDGASDSRTFTTSVSLPNEKPLAYFEVSCDELDCRVDGSASADPDGTIASYEWNFGDGQSASGQTATHRYADDGEFTVTLTVRDNLGAAASSSKTVRVERRQIGQEPEPPVEPDPEPDPPESPPPEPAPPEAPPTEPGPDPDPEPEPEPESDNAAPRADFSSVCYGDRCSFDAAPSHDSDGDIVSYSWSFGDGRRGQGEALQHVFDQGGRYRVVLTVEDDRGGTDSIWRYVEVESPEAATPLVEFTVRCRERSCTLDAGSSTNHVTETARFDWAFGDGTSGEGRTVSHEYARDGVYRVTLKVSGPNELSASRTRWIKIASERPIELLAVGGRQNDRGIVVLKWSEATTSTVIILRNGKPIAEVMNNGKYVDTDSARLHKSAAYQICDSFGANCSEEISVVIGSAWGAKPPESKTPPAKARR